MPKVNVVDTPLRDIDRDWVHRENEIKNNDWNGDRQADKTPKMPSLAPNPFFPDHEESNRDLSTKVEIQ